MEKKRRHKIYQFALILIVIVFSSLITFALTTQSSWGKEKILLHLQKMADAQGVHFQIKKIQGLFPLKYSFSDIELKLSENQSLFIDSLDARIAFFPLLRKELCISSLTAKNVSINSSSSFPPLSLTPFDSNSSSSTSSSISSALSLESLSLTPENAEKILAKTASSETLTSIDLQNQKTFSFPPLPFSVVLRKVRIEKFSIVEPNSKPLFFKIHAKAKIAKEFKTAYFDIAMESTLIKTSSLHLIALAKKNPSNLFLRITSSSDTLKTFPFISNWINFKNLDLNFSCKLEAKGPVERYVALLSQISPSSSKAHARSLFDNHNNNNNKNNNPAVSLPTAPLLAKFFATINSATLSQNKAFNQQFANTGLLIYATIKDPSNIFIPRGKIENKLFTLKAKGALDFTGTLLQSEVLLKAQDLSLLSSSLLLPLEGKLSALAHIKPQNNIPQLQMEVFASSLSVKKIPFSDFAGKISASLKKELAGEFQFSSIIGEENLTAKSPFLWDMQNSTFKLTDFSLTSLNTKIVGSGAFLNHIFEGSFHGWLHNLKELSLLLPVRKCRGDLEFTADFSNKNNATHLNLKADLSNVSFSSLHAKTATFLCELDHPFSSPTGPLSFQIQNGDLYNLHIDEITLQTALDKQAEFTFHSSGVWKEFFSVKSKGSLFFENSLFKAQVQELSGSLFGKSLSSSHPIFLEWDLEHFLLKDLEILLDNSSTIAHVEISPSLVDIRIMGSHVPVEFLSLNKFSLSIEGFTSFQAILQKQKQEKWVSNIHVQLENIIVTPPQKDQPIHAKGDFSAELEDNLLVTKGQLQVEEEQLFELSAKIPLNLIQKPFAISVHPTRNLQAEIIYNGKIEEILGFFNLDTHRVEGEINCHFSLSKNFLHPKVEGHCVIKNGVYENYYTGTYLQEIALDIEAEKDVINLTSLTANDQDAGSIKASGSFHLNRKEHFPFFLKTELNNITCIQSDFITAKAQGVLNIIGNSLMATATGAVEVTKADLLIPEELPKKIPEISITFLHKFSDESESFSIPPSPTYPLHLDVNIFAHDNVHITGQGLHSEWKGSFQVKGTNTHLLASGNLDLIKGDFSFSGRKFTLTRGSLSFTGKDEIPYLSLEAKMQQKGVTVLADLKGPLSAPELSFRSSPPLPVSSILSLLIFGQDISEITGMQSLQLAMTIGSLSGGPTVMEEARKHLGIDRFAIVSTPATSVDEPDKLAVQVGKYITQGILVSFSQGLEQGSSNVIVEVDLKKGFTFQAETIQEQQQGKFTLKWNFNY
jgi:autotransporter translocation and assembly factor TamB